MILNWARKPGADIVSVMQENKSGALCCWFGNENRACWSSFRKRDQRSLHVFGANQGLRPSGGWPGTPIKMKTIRAIEYLSI